MDKNKVLSFMNEEPKSHVSMTPKFLLLECRNITKSFGSFLANDDINFNIREGEIHGLLGENGAGKSTFVKMVYGLLEPSGGDFYWSGKKIKIRGPQGARDIGIGMVFQHFTLFPTLTVIENIQLALNENFNLQELRETIIKKSAEFGFLF